MTTPSSILALQRACDLLGSQSLLAAAVGVERATQGAVTRHNLRPDLYPEIS